MLGRAAKLHRPLAECVIRNEVARIQRSEHTLVPNQIPCISTAAGAAGLSAIPESNAKQITQIWDTPAQILCCSLSSHVVRYDFEAMGSSAVSYPRS